MVESFLTLLRSGAAVDAGKARLAESREALDRLLTEPFLGRFWANYFAPVLEDTEVLGYRFPVSDTEAVVDRGAFSSLFHCSTAACLHATIERWDADVFAVIGEAVSPWGVIWGPDAPPPPPIPPVPPESEPEPGNARI